MSDNSPQKGEAEGAGVVDDPNPWRPTNEAPCQPGTYINVRTVTTYRWLAYKRDGARQMKAPGRWQIATPYGWQNASLPPGEWQMVREGDDCDGAHGAGGRE